MFHSRGYRGSRRRSGGGLGNVVQSYKKILYIVNASFSAGFQNEEIALGVDSVAAGQTSATDVQCPTGCIIKYIEVQFAAHNIVAGPCYLNCTLQYRLQSQAGIDPRLMGGNAQRNQCLHMDNFSVGQHQNSTHKFKFKIPKKFQRLREGMKWTLVWSNTATVNREIQIIYKFYR